MNSRYATMVLAFCAMIHDASAGEPSMRYLGKGRTAGSAVVEFAGGERREIRRGETIPSLGVVVDADDDHLSLQQPLTSAEMSNLQAEGRAYHENRIVVVPRGSLELLPDRPDR